MTISDTKTVHTYPIEPDILVDTTLFPLVSISYNNPSVHMYIHSCTPPIFFHRNRSFHLALVFRWFFARVTHVFGASQTVKNDELFLKQLQGRSCSIFVSYHYKLVVLFKMM